MIFLLREGCQMTEREKERILDILWRAMSAAANHDDIPMEAQVIAEEASNVLDMLIAASPQDNG